jgi:hypothetical protein
MKIIELIEDNAVQFTVAVIAGFFAAIAAWVSTIFAGALFFRDEMSYGFPLAFGVPAAFVGGVSVFALVFRKLRAL